MDNIVEDDGLQQQPFHRHGDHRVPCDIHIESRMRRRIKYYFMNPCEKWRAKGKFPWKLVLQIIKVVLVTVQLALFGIDRASHVSFLEKNVVTFKHLFLKGWDPSFETLPYPPSTGTFAIYMIDNFYSSVDHALEQYHNVEANAIGIYNLNKTHNRASPLVMCVTRYTVGNVWENQSYRFNSDTVTECIALRMVNVTYKNHTVVQKYDTREFLRQHNHSIIFDRLIKVELKLALKTVHLRILSHLDEPDCFLFNITILYDNSGHNGQVPVTLTARETPLHCKGEILYKSNEKLQNALYTLFDVIVILLSIASMLLCLRSLQRAQSLRVDIEKFFKRYLGKDLDRNDRFEFMNMWFVLIIVNDIFTVCGSVLKITIENKMMNDYEVCGVMLGTGNLLVWIGVLRYLGFFGKYYNILILTIKKSAPNVLRFLVCAAVFYFGFIFCGWVVLGPYHVKFRSISTASECLFSLVNGDDMFVTFSIITSNSYVWWYSRIYLYVFISLFIYIVLNVFISVIMDTYETIKDYYTVGFPKTPLHEFIDKSDEVVTSSLYKSDDEVFNARCCCWPHFPCNRHDGEESERTSLLHGQINT